MALKTGFETGLVKYCLKCMLVLKLGFLNTELFYMPKPGLNKNE